MGIRDFFKKVRLIAFNCDELVGKIVLIDASIMLYEFQTPRSIVAFISGFSAQYSFFPYIILDGKTNPLKVRKREPSKIEEIRAKKIELIQLLRDLGLPYLVAPCESDHQMAFMVFIFPCPYHFCFSSLLVSLNCMNNFFLFPSFLILRR